MIHRFRVAGTIDGYLATIAFVLTFVGGALALHAQTPSVYPPVLYFGDNLVTISYEHGIERVVMSPSTNVRVEYPSVFMPSCPDSVTVWIRVESATSSDSVALDVYGCDGSVSSRTIYSEDWRILHEYTGDIPVGQDTCLQCVVESTTPRQLDSITVDHPDLEVLIASPRTGGAYRVEGGVTFNYRVCYTPSREESTTDTIVLHFRREFASDSLRTYVIKKPVTLQSHIPEEPPPVPGADLPPLRDPTTYRNILMPTAEPVGRDRYFFGNYLIAGNLAGVGLTDRLSLLGGGVLFPVEPNYLYLGTLGARYQAVDLHDFSMSVGAQLAYSSTEDSKISTVAPYAVASYGDHERRVSLAGGYGLKRHTTPAESFSREALTIAVGGYYAFARGWKFAAEGYFIESSGITPMVFTFRRFSESFAFDFGLGIDLAGGSDVSFTGFLSGEIDRLSVIPVLSAMWVF